MVAAMAPRAPSWWLLSVAALSMLCARRAAAAMARLVPRPCSVSLDQTDQLLRRLSRRVRNERAQRAAAVHAAQRRL